MRNYKPFQILLIFFCSSMMFSGCDAPPEVKIPNKPEPPPIESSKETVPPDDKTNVEPNEVNSVQNSVEIEPLHPGHIDLPDSVVVKNAVKLMEGQISYFIPDTIEVGEPFFPSVMIADTSFLESKMISETAALGAASGEPVKLKEIRFAKIKIAEKMRAELFEPGDKGNFTIKPQGVINLDLIPENETKAQQQWTVVANNPGRHSLVLTLEAIFYKGEREITQNIPVFSEKVFAEEIFIETVDKNSWKPYVLGGGFAAIFTVFFMWLRGRRGSLASSNIENVIEKIGQGETAEAIKMLQAKKLSNTNENLLVNHLAEFNDIRRQFNGGMIERADMQMVVNRIHNSLLEICDELQA